MPTGDGAAVHGRISALLSEYAAIEHVTWVGTRDLGPLPTWQALAQTSRDDQRAVAMGLAERIQWSEDNPLPEGLPADSAASIQLGARVGADAALRELLRRTLPFSWDDLEVLLDLAVSGPIWRDYRSWGGLLQAIESRAEEGPVPDSVRDRLARSLKKLAHRETAENRAYAGRINLLLGGGPRVDLESGEPWSDQALADLGTMDDGLRSKWVALLLHAQDVASAKPTARWIKAAVPLVNGLGVEELGARLTRWFELVAAPSPALPDEDPDRWTFRAFDLRPAHEDLLKGLAWSCGLNAHAALARALTRLAVAAWRKVPGRGPRASKVGNACVWALGAMPGTEGMGQLALLQVKAKFRPALAEIDKALTATAKRLGLPREEIEELGVPTYGLTQVGVRHELLGEVTAELRITGTSSTELRWLRADGKAQKTPPASIGDTHAEALAELKQAAKDIQKMLPAQRERLDRLALARKSWPIATWRERYLDHPLLGTLARRLIWRFLPDGEGQNSARSGAYFDGALVGTDDVALLPPSPSTRVELWHPLVAGTDEVVRWRAWLIRHEVSQPFKQAHREIYPLTPAERATRVYSNRFAAHIVKQHQFHALCQARGWKDQLRLMVDDDVHPPSIELPAWGLRAEFWVEGVGSEYQEDTNETGTYLRLVTDQVRFYPIGARLSDGHAGGGGFRVYADPLSLEEVPPLVFSEVMRDVDLFVGVSSVGNDPTWSDGGPEGRAIDAWNHFAFGELTESAKTRKEVLEGLIPRLAIRDRCSFVDRFLVVRGDRRTYKIHLGSGNIRMEPDDAYLCIVATSSADAPKSIYLPFEGDRTLALVLSKALLLAGDGKIKDESILRQLHPR